MRFNADTIRQPSLIVGLNQYSHDCSVCVVREDTGDIVFALSKERVSRRKHDGGDCSLLLQHAFETLSMTYGIDARKLIDDHVRLIVANNHHFRIAPFERRIPFQVSLRYLESSYESPWNLIDNGGQRKIEMSHHLAHAYSALYKYPYAKQGGCVLVVVMDGMGDNLNDWLRHNCKKNVEHNDDNDDWYYNELNCIEDHPEYFQQYPKQFESGMSYREAETVYLVTFNNDSFEVQRIFKRWTPENEPSELTNHSFEEMDSVGAMYSRVSSIIFKDWNNCGKVMGLAPFHSSKRTPSSERMFIEGDLFDGSIDMRKGKREGLVHLHNSFKDVKANRSRELLSYYEQISYGVQNDLEEVVTKFIGDLIEQTGVRDIVFCGGVAQNSSLNSKISDMADVNTFYLNAYPGDEGIAVGCGVFGRYLLHQEDVVSATTMADVGSVGSRNRYEMPFYGRLYSKEEIEKCIVEKGYDKWLSIKQVANYDELCDECSRILVDNNKIIGWFYGRSEFGARALGHRSILSNCNSTCNRNFINVKIKTRELFRPLAPVVLEEDYSKFFAPDVDTADGALSSNVRHMGMTRGIRKDLGERDRKGIEGIIHVDDSARVQVVHKDDEGNEVFRQLLKHVQQRPSAAGGILLNTSFNLGGQPIVESPSDAVRTFLECQSLDCLVLADALMVVDRKPFKRAFHYDEVEMNGMWVASAVDAFHSSVCEDSYGECVRASVKVVRGTGGNDGALEWEEVGLKDGLQVEILEMIHNSDGQRLGVSEIVEILCGQDDEGASFNDVAERIEGLNSAQLIYTISS